jgi:hypothetical protein
VLPYCTRDATYGDWTQKSFVFLAPFFLPLRSSAPSAVNDLTDKLLFRIFSRLRPFAFSRSDPASFRRVNRENPIWRRRESIERTLLESAFCPRFGVPAQSSATPYRLKTDRPCLRCRNINRR